MASGYLRAMGVGSVFLLAVIIVVVVGVAAFLFLTTAGLELREGRRRRRAGRPQHMRVENEQRSVSSPPRSHPARASEQERIEPR
jgi:hypothetical protein